MDDKMFELMEKMYVELQGLKSGQEQIKTDVSDIRKDIQKLGSKIDGEIAPKSEALLDGYKQNSEKLEEIDEKIDRLRMDVNSISIKTDFNDSRIIELTRDFKKAK